MLTAREHAVMRELITGATGREIGERLGISHRTVEIHRASVCRKLGASNAVQAAVIFDRMGRAG